MTTPGARLGLATTLRAALNAGLLVGLVVGIADGLGAGLRTGTEGLVTWLGCLAAAALIYGLVWSALALLFGLALHARLRERDLGQRFAAVCAPVLGLGLFTELYWWTRPFLFYGLPATDPKRLAVALLLLPAALALGYALVHLGRRLPNALRWAGAALVPVAWLGGGAFIVHSSREAAEFGKLNERTRELPNVLLFVCDAMRADKLGCYGDERVQTPRMDQLAREGVLFERALVQAPFTGSSFGSYFTGKYPRRHGFVKMAADTRMAPNITLASHLKSAALLRGGRLEPTDYQCITFMTGAISQASGLARGFDAYFEAFMGHDLVDVQNPWSVFRSELVLSIFKAKLEQRLTSTPVADEAARWFAEHGDKRFFAMVHLFSTHTPYDPPQDLRDQYCDPTYDGPVRVFRSDHAHAIHRGHATPSEADKRQIADLYAGGVTHTDRQIAQVLAALEARGVLDDTIVIVTADHGEELGEHGVWEHNHMFQSNLRVPLIVSWPNRLPFGRRVSALVESIDLVPTVCEWIGLAPPFEERLDDQGRNYGALDGLSLAPLVEGRVDSVREFSFAENGVEMSVQDLEWKLVVPFVDQQMNVFSLQGRSFESLESLASSKPRLFHLASDPGELHDVVERERPVAERLFAELQRWDASMPIPRIEIVLSDRDREEHARRLRELGYADGIGRDVAPSKGK